ncbi:DsbA family oxidoreductase [Mucilaginibacter sp.]|uniref:DsbA family oxidoreductase n=1 Tax=Mucilaginibacter sp. TaxID=1882438 RepID=UPI0026084F5D|nr:DsbA family oxidoreductase [Mucilaginibacter sp.]MDB5030325.1 putative dithiol-disulfide isomerase, DsbA family [Mucilaginibacter sp.]
MKIQIWSDVMCPFCYIGKRRFEDALQQFEHKDEVEIEWKSFQLNPDLKTDPNLNITQYLADIKGWTFEYAQQLNDQVTEMAAEVGLTYNFDKAVVANSFDAHRFAHLAKQNGLGDEAEETLFKAYFTEGKNIADHDTLAELGESIGLDKAEVEHTLAGNKYAINVQQDIAQAQQLGIHGVPFFVMDNKFGVSGAQAVPVFLQTLEKSYSEWATNKQPKLDVIEGDSCEVGGDC